MGLCTRGEGGGFFVSHVNPSNLGLRSNRVGDSIQRVARESINALNASTRESLNQQFRNVHSHRAAPFPFLRYNSALSPRRTPTSTSRQGGTTIFRTMRPKLIANMSDSFSMRPGSSRPSPFGEFLFLPRFCG